jgi:hypothetical protein
MNGWSWGGGLPAVEDRLDDVRCEEGEAEDGGDIGGVLAVRLSEFVDRGVVARFEERLPVECPHEGVEERRVDLGPRRYPGAGPRR